MKIYHYDEKGFFLWEGVADESPAEPGVYIMPSQTTTKKPLKPKEGTKLQFNGEKWVRVKATAEE